MPHQETFFDKKSGQMSVKVLKTYDRAYAREAFNNMNEAAYAYLWNVMKIEQDYDTSDISSTDEANRLDFLWGEVEDAAREDGNVSSFFIVNEQKGTNTDTIYVSADWPSAEAFAKDRLQSAQ